MQRLPIILDSHFVYNADPTLAAPALIERPEWTALQGHFEAVHARSLRELFQADGERERHFSLEAAGLYFDFSKHRIDRSTLPQLFALARACGLAEHIEAMFTGAKINTSEKRAALHTALRAPRTSQIFLDGVDVVPGVHEVLDQMGRFALEVRSGAWLGHTGRRIRNVVNIGIGGSDLGPAMAYEALRPYSLPELRVRFVANVDASDFAESTRDLDAAETLFIVASKTFTTLETMTNAHRARAWVRTQLGPDAQVARHFVAVSTNHEAVSAFGIDTANMFGFWDWVGGRFSMDSAIGLSTMVAIGPAGFAELLGGFRQMDEHFRQTPFEANAPVIMALLGIWYNNFFRAQTAAVLPYSQYLRHFPAYLQQLTMESNGKHVTHAGKKVDYQTGPIYWGQQGTNGQHSFYELLHQGTRLVPVDFIGFCRNPDATPADQDLLIANLFAQGAALAFGKTEAEVLTAGSDRALAPHRAYEGNRPSTTILAETLSPATLGSLVALYEHLVFTQGVIWDINSFDQWGVELGKVLAQGVVAELANPSPTGAGHDVSTAALIARYRTLRGP